MKNNQSKTSCKRGFTLIELLVVVLIIGILAAVAVPQYRIAVEKAHAAEALAQVKTLAVAQKAYFLANGQYADTFEKLDVNFEGIPDENLPHLYQKNWYISVYRINDNDYHKVYAGRLGEGVEDQAGRWYIEYTLSDDKMYCSAYANDVQANKVCKTFGPVQACPFKATRNCYQIS